MRADAVCLPAAAVVFADVTQVSSSVSCSVSVDDDQLMGFADSSRMFVGAEGVSVSVQVTNSSLTSDHTCSHSL